MSLITKDHLSLIIKTFKELLQRNLDTKIDRSEFTEENAIKFVIDMDLVSPIVANDGSIYTDENGAIYSL